MPNNNKRQATEKAEMDLDDSIESIRSEILSNKEPTMKDVAMLLFQLIDKASSTRNTVNDISDRLAKIENRYDQTSRRLKSIEERCGTHTTSIDALEKAKTTNEEKIDLLKSLTDSNEQSLHKLEQSKIDNDIFLSGFPIKPDHIKVKSALANFYNIAPDMIDHSYQYEFILQPKATSTPNAINKVVHNVVVSFKERNVKFAFMKKKKELGEFLYEQIDSAVKDPKDKAAVIKCSNRLTKFNLLAQRQLFRAKGEGKIHSFQLHNGTFRAKKDEKAKWTYVDTSTSLDLISK